MELHIKNQYKTVFHIADEIEEFLCEQNIEHHNVSDVLRIDIRDFLFFLVITDHVLSKEEIKYINDVLDYKYDSEELKQIIVNTKAVRDDFLNNPPLSLTYFMKYGYDPLLRPVIGNYDLEKLYVQLFQVIGEDFLSKCKHIKGKEVDQLTRYRFMLESKIKAYNKSGEMKIDRPDSIPFVRKGGVEEQREALDREPETEFIGTVSGGDKTSDDLDSLLEELDSLIGLASVKTEVKNLINLLKIIELRKQNGLKAPSVAKHFVFTGNPGTGKTTVARLLSEIFCALGILSKGHIVEVDRSGLVAGYVGQTAIKVKEVVDKALGGVLFIDEAYSLANESNGGDFGQEAIDTLVKAMEDNRDNLIVIVAGYPDLMSDFIDSNPGLKSRFQKTINFPDYDADDLLCIFERNCAANDYTLEADAKDYLYDQLLDYVENKDENFGNARDIRNFLDIAVSSQANRLLEMDLSNPDVLTTLTKEDIESIFLEEQF